MQKSTTDDEILNAEKEIDAEFRHSPLMEIGYDQAIWTLLSTLEDLYLKNSVIRPLKPELFHAYVDTVINATAHTVRSLFSQKKSSDKKLIKSMSNEHYEWAHQWIDESLDYNSFNLIFPLWHKEKINLSIRGEYIDPGDLEITSNKYDYEAYNRIVRKDGALGDTYFDVESVFDEVARNTTISGDRFSLNFNPRLVEILQKAHNNSLSGRHVLPSDWRIGDITFNDFKKTLTTIQAMMHGWFIARVHAVNEKIPNYGYSSSLLVITRQELVKRLARYTSLQEPKVNTVLEYLSFSSHDIRYPDIAIQPLIELSDKRLLLSPFILININAERNFCTLLNKIPLAREAYLSLTLKKERILFEELRTVLEQLGYEVTHGSLSTTDLDIAIIDRANKVCACIELKWFIEPAEIREVIERSIELTKGVKQCKAINALFSKRDKRLTRDILNIDESYRTSTFVGSRNWIGHSDIWSLDVPVVKVWHFVKELINQGNLANTLDWVESRNYLPVNGKDYWIVPVDIKTGTWKSQWYGVATWPPTHQATTAEVSEKL
ncbi:hypothetical protein ACIOVC_05655 [Pseudomonas neuropathica]